MNERYGLNLRTLKRHVPYVIDKLEAGTDPTGLAIEPVEGFRNVLLSHQGKRCYANSLYDVAAEMQRYFAEMDENCRTVIVLGLGNGYVLEHISRNYPKVERVVLIEPSTEVLRAAMYHINLEKYINKFDISLLVGFTSEQTVGHVAPMVEERLNTGIHVVTQHYFASLFSELNRSISDELMKLLRREATQVSTSFHTPYLRLVNAMTNLSHQSRSAAELVPLLKDNTVFIVSAGPSLKKNMHLIEDAKKRGVVIGVGTAIEILDQNGIQPHFRAAFSPHVDTTIFKNLKDNTIPLLYLDSLYHDILPAYEGQLYKLVSTSEVLTQYIMSRLNAPCHQLITEVSIANVIFEFCLQSRAPQVVLLGQDMAFTGNQMYAEGSLWNPVIREHEPGLIQEKGYGEQMVYTDIKFLGMRDALVRSLIRNGRTQDHSVLNCTEGGLLIPYTDSANLADLIGTLAEKQSLAEAMPAYRQHEDALEDSAYRRKVSEVFEEIREDVRQIQLINEERVALLTIMMEEREAGKSAERLVKRYEEMNAFEDRLKTVPLYRDVIQQEFHGIFRSIILAFKYQGKDVHKQLEAAENMMVRVCLEVRKVVNTFKMLIDEFYGIEYPEGIGAAAPLPDELMKAVFGECAPEPVIVKETLN